MGRKSFIGAACVIFSVLYSNLHAANFSYTGNFVADDDVRLFDFTADGVSNVVLRTYGFGGGTQDNKTEINPGGFYPMLTLFESRGYMGSLLNDGTVPGVGIDPVTNLGLDVLFGDVLPAGDYTLALTQYGNFSVTTPDDFSQTGNPNYSAGYEFPAPCSQGQFCYEDVNRTSFWAVDILNVESASVVPVPAAAWLFGSGLLGLVVLARRNRV